MSRPWIAAFPMLLALTSPGSAEEGDPPEVEAPAEKTYKVSPSKSTFAVIIRNDPSAMLSRMGHDHVIQATKASGEVVWPTREGGACSAVFEIPVKSLVVDPPGSREREGLDDNTISDSQKDKLAANMWGRSQLDADNHPTVRFEVPACQGGEGKVKVNGKLTIRGVTKELEVPLQITRSGDTLRARGSFTTTHSDHEFKPFRGSPMGPRNAEELTFSIDMVAKE